MKKAFLMMAAVIMATSVYADQQPMASTTQQGSNVVPSPHKGKRPPHLIGPGGIHHPHLLGPGGLPPKSLTPTNPTMQPLNQPMQTVNPPMQTVNPSMQKVNPSMQTVNPPMQTVPPATSTY